MRFKLEKSDDARSFLYKIVVLSYGLSLILPQVIDSRDTGKIIFSFLVPLETLSFISSPPASFQLYDFLIGIFSLLVPIFLLFAILFSYLSFRRYKGLDPSSQEFDARTNKLLTFTTIFGWFAWFGIMTYRDMLAIYALYDVDLPNYNISHYSIGFYFLLFTIFLTYYLKRMDYYVTIGEAIENFKNKIKKLGEFIWGPTFVMMLSIHITTLLVMVINFGIFYGPIQAINGPTYYLELILTYGLNRNYPLNGFITTFSWIFAPMFVLTIGLLLYIVETGGFAPNGPHWTQVVPVDDKYLIPERKFSEWAFFSRIVPGAESWIGSNPKLTNFYLVVVFLSIILGIVVGSVINYRLFAKEKVPTLKYLLGYQVVTSWFVGVIMANITAKTIVTPSRILKSVFFDRSTNYFIHYPLFDGGAYHPLSLFWAILFLWAFISAFIVILNYTINTLLTGEMFEAKESRQIVGKLEKRSTGEKGTLPFDKS